MKKFIFGLFVCAFGVAFSIGSTQEVEAGPFGNQGHWVETPDGGKVCATHWWANKCIVDQDGGTVE